MAESVGDIALAPNAQELLLGPGKAGFNIWLAELLT
jgi:hypothetical protein